jgi:hypothetical protein
MVVLSIQPAALRLQNHADVLNRLDEFPGLEFAVCHPHRLQRLIGKHRQNLAFRGPQKKRAVFPPNLEYRVSKKDGMQVGDGENRRRQESPPEEIGMKPVRLDSFALSQASGSVE